VPPDTRELFRRFQRQRRQTWRQRLWTPLAIRIPLFDPDRFLDRTAFLVRPLFGWFGALLWLSVVTAGLVLAGLNWPALSENVIDRALAPQNLFLLWLVYPLVKAIHELGHAYATKIYGGEVHEIGVMFLVFVPVPYVDASAASGFPDKRQRMVVGAIGIGVEMLLAAVAVFVFAYATVGPVHAVAYNVIPDRRRLHDPVQRQSAVALRRLLRAGGRSRIAEPGPACEIVISATSSSDMPTDRARRAFRRRIGGRARGSSFTASRPSSTVSSFPSRSSSRWDRAFSSSAWSLCCGPVPAS
jgi:hypothetical protein